METATELLMPPESFPKLLVATEFSPNASGGGPAVVRQLLKNWPVDRLYWWSCRRETDFRFGQKVAEHATAAIPSRLYPNRRWTQQRSWLLERVWSRWAGAHLRSNLSRIKPDVVWAIPHLWSILPLHEVLPNAKIGFHVSVHDYPDIRNAAVQLGSSRSKRFADAVDQLYSTATSRDAICAPMVDDLKTRTGCPGGISHAGIESADFTYLVGKQSKPQPVIRIAYAGTIIVEPEFRLFVQGLQKVRKKMDRPISLEFFGSHSYSACDWFDASWMREHGNLAEPALSEGLRTCAWGFSPMALADDDPRYNRFSFPTKFISYLAAGLPVITMGHPQSSVVKAFSEFQTGVCITSSDSAEIERQLIAALSARDPWELYGAELVRCGRERFDAEKLRENLTVRLVESACSLPV